MELQSRIISSVEKLEQTYLWEAFISHVDSLYFSGASELLDNQTIAFEYELFKSYFS